MKMPIAKSIAVKDIKPYPNNPRHISEEAVDAVADSIERYGYQQPIVVDTDNVIVVGHTRFRALKKLKYKKIEVYVTDLPADKVNEYRLIDNRTGEMTTWDFDALVLELREFEEGILNEYFPDMDLEIGMISEATQVSKQDMENAADKITSVKEADPTAVHTTTVECPSCFHQFQVRTRSLPGLSHDDLGTLANGETE